MKPEPSQTEQAHLRRAIALAQSARGSVEPNPMVGCVIVKDGRIIGEGLHRRFGEAHAEPDALAACRESPEGATAYVTLEPCCHTNKKTPPCAPRLIAARIARVVIGARDPNPSVDGRGIQMLREAGIDVIEGVCEPEALQLIAPFIAATRQQRPYVTMKWAQSSDGRVAGAKGRRVQIGNAASQRVVHQLRARSDAIAVGANTVLSDDPLLTVRLEEPGGVSHPRRPIRVILSDRLRIPVTSRLAQSAAEHPTIAYCSTRVAQELPKQAEALRRLGVEVCALPTRDEGRFALTDVFADLHRRGVTHLLVEPGSVLAGYLIERNLFDRAWVIRSRMAIDEPGAPEAPLLDLPPSGEVELAGDRLTEYLNPRSTVFFANVASADLLLAGAVIHPPSTPA